ncbi:MAG: hypothetical protein JWN93_3751 [Hyphomicrobiales bacterium]|nr:hypothetical protein [Hyphomicrobiales bacterium]
MSGVSPLAPLRTFARALRLIDGQMCNLYLRRGDAWSEMLHIRNSLNVSSFGEGPPPRIDGEGRRHGALIEAGTVHFSDVDVENAVNGVYVTGPTAVGFVERGTFTGCGTGLVAGGGGVLALASDVVCQQSVRALGAGDGIQISEDAGAGPHIVRRAQCHGNAMSGFNFKIGRARVEASSFTDNGECGVLAQVNADELVLEQNFVGYNNRSDNGTFNLGVEDSAKVLSRRNIYIDPMGRTQVCNNVNMSGASRVDCQSDQFIERDDAQNMGATLRFAVAQNAGVLSLRNCSFYADRTQGVIVDAYGASGAQALSVHNCAFWSRGVRVFRYPVELTGRVSIDFNCYYRNDGGVLVEVQDRAFFRARDARVLISQRGTDASSVFADPMFMAPAAAAPDLALREGSPARAKGSPDKSSGLDYYDRPFPRRPNIGSRS